MAVSKLVEKLLKILPYKVYSDGTRSIANSTLTVRKILAGYELRYGWEYEAPNFNLKHMKALAELFGLNDEGLDVNNYSESGCETCDYGSDYGFTIQLISPTRHAKELEALANSRANIHSKDFDAEE